MQVHTRSHSNQRLSDTSALLHELQQGLMHRILFRLHISTWTKLPCSSMGSTTMSWTWLRSERARKASRGLRNT